MVATPLLYRMLSFRLPVEMNKSDSLIRQLETCASLRFPHTQYTTNVAVWGMWYRGYDDLDSQLGKQNVLSPAVQMLSALLAICVSKMHQLKVFV